MDHSNWVIQLVCPALGIWPFGYLHVQKSNITITKKQGIVNKQISSVTHESPSNRAMIGKCSLSLKWPFCHFIQRNGKWVFMAKFASVEIHNYIGLHVPLEVSPSCGKEDLNVGCLNYKSRMLTTRSCCLCLISSDWSHPVNKVWRRDSSWRRATLRSSSSWFTEVRLWYTIMWN